MPKTQLPLFSTLLFLLLFLHTQIKICNGVSVLGLNSLKSSQLDAIGRRFCAGKIGECSTMTAVEEEVEMVSESNRRVLLVQKKFISYETLRRDIVPCTRPGASYYNCNGAGPANTYHRGCEVITRCARDW